MVQNPTLIPDQTYKVSATEVVLNVPTYDKTPSNADVSYSWTITLSPTPTSTVASIVNTNQVKILTTDPAKTGIYTATLTLTEDYSHLTRTTTFKITVSCLTSITAPSALTDTYYISDSAQTLQIPDFTRTPSGCPHELTYTVALSPSGSLPASITFSQDATLTTANKYKLVTHETTWANSGTFTVVITASDAKSTAYAQKTDATAVVLAQLTATITIKCIKSLDIKSGTIASFTYQIDLDTPWTSTTALPVFEQNPSNCPAGTITRSLVYTGAGSAPSFISVNGSNQVSVATQDASNVNTYAYKIVGSTTENGSTIINEADTFTVTVSGPTLVTSITLGTIGDLTYRVGSGEVLLDVP